MKARNLSATLSRQSRSFKTLAGWLKQKRLAESLTMRDMGESLNSPHSLIGKVENCERNLSLIEYIVYCEALGADPVSGLKHILEQVRGEFKQGKAVKITR